MSENDFEKCTSEEDNEEGDNGSDDDMMKEVSLIGYINCAF